MSYSAALRKRRAVREGDGGGDIMPCEFVRLITGRGGVGFVLSINEKTGFATIQDINHPGHRAILHKSILKKAIR